MSSPESIDQGDPVAVMMGATGCSGGSSAKVTFQTEDGVSLVVATIRGSLLPMGCQRGGGGEVNAYEKLLPQPQVRLTLGLLMANPAPIKPSL